VSDREVTTAEYKKYLTRLCHLISVELVPKTAVFDYFTERIYKIEPKLDDLEPLMWYVQSGFHYDITFSLYRLFDKKADRNIFHFIDFTEKNLENIFWAREPLTENNIQEQRRLLESVHAITERLRKRRNKFFAHYDKDYFDKPEQIDVDFPFTNEDAKQLVRILQKIINQHTHAFSSSGILSLEGFVYVAAAKLFNAIRNKPH
jgi:hypothetical protein